MAGVTHSVLRADFDFQTWELRSAIGEASGWSDIEACRRSRLPHLEVTLASPLGVASHRPASTGNKCWVPHCPDFLRRLMALIHSMRLSLMKGAHADLSSAAWQEIGVKPGFGLSGIPRTSTAHCTGCR